MSGRQTVGPGVELIKEQAPDHDLRAKLIGGSYIAENTLSGRSVLSVAFAAGTFAAAGYFIRQAAEGVAFPKPAVAANIVPVTAHPNECPSPLAGAGTYNFEPNASGTFEPGSTDLAVNVRDVYSTVGPPINNDSLCVTNTPSKVKNNANQGNILEVGLTNLSTETPIDNGTITVTAGLPGQLVNSAGVHFSIDKTYPSRGDGTDLVLYDCAPGTTNINGVETLDDSTYSCDFSLPAGGVDSFNVITTATKLVRATQPVTIMTTTGNVVDTNSGNNVATKVFKVIGGKNGETADKLSRECKSQTLGMVDQLGYKVLKDPRKLEWGVALESPDPMCRQVGRWTLKTYAATFPRNPRVHERRLGPIHTIKNPNKHIYNWLETLPRRVPDPSNKQSLSGVFRAAWVPNLGGGRKAVRIVKHTVSVSSATGTQY